MAYHVVIPARYASTRLPGKPLLRHRRPHDDPARGGAGSSQRRGPSAGRHRRRAHCGGSPRSARTRGVDRGDDRCRAAVRHRSCRRRGAPAGLGRRHDRGQRAGRRTVRAAAPDRPGGRSAGARSGRPPSPRSRRRSNRCTNSWIPTWSRWCARPMARRCISAARRFPGRATARARDSAARPTFAGALRHVGLYAYRVGALKRITAMAPSTYEQAEKLEQLRALQAGLRIAVALCAEPPGPGIDTDADLQRARARAATEPGAR